MELQRLVEDGFYREAERLGRELLLELGGREAGGEGAGLQTAEVSLWLAAALRRTGDPRAEETLRLAREAVAGKRNGLGKEDPSYAVALRELATLQLMRGERDLAGAALLESEAILERSGAAAELGMTQVRLGSWALSVQDPVAAEVFLARAAQTLAGLPDGEVADSWRWQTGAILHEGKGEHASAREACRRALELRERNLRPDHPLIGHAEYDLARQLVVEGDYSGARELLEDARVVLTRAYGEDHRLLFFPLQLQAGVLDVLGDPGQARPLYARALELVEKGSVTELEAASCRLALARSLANDVRHQDEGFAAYERYFELYRALGRPARADLASGLIYFGGSLERAGALERAEQAYRESRGLLEELEREAAPERFSLAMLLVNEGSLRLRRGQAREAREDAQRALALLEEELGPGHLRLMWPLETLARAELRLGRDEAALAAAARVEALSRQNLRDNCVGLGDGLVASYAAELREITQSVLALALERPSERRWTEWAFDTVIRRRAFVLEQLHTRARLARASADPKVARLCAELQRARARLANQVFALTYAAAGPEPGYRERLAETQREKEHLERALARDARATSGTPVELGLAEVRASLPRGVALAAYVRTLEHAGEDGERAVYLAFVLAGGEAPVQLVPLGGAQAVEAEASAWRAELSALDAPGEERLRAAGRRLRERVLAPVLERVAGATSVCLVPDGVLHSISFAALPVGADRYQIEDGPALRLLVAERDLVPSEFEPGVGLLALGAPELGELDGARRLPRLTEAEAEVRELEQRWNQSRPAEEPALLLVGAQATEESLRRESASRRALHVACHGFARRPEGAPVLVASRGDWGLVQDAPVLESLEIAAGAGALAERGLLLAPDLASGADGFLSAEELAGFDLDGVEWAVLAACSSGAGPIEAGEGVLGLQRALRLAGVRTTITSLWPVEDAATRSWTRAFYAACLERGLGAAAATDEAARAVLAERRAAGQSTHPFFWAAFVAAGGGMEP